MQYNYILYQRNLIILQSFVTIHETVDIHGLQKCINYVASNFDKFSQVDTEGVEPLVHGIEMSNVFREDEVIKEIDRETLLSSAPDRNEGFYQVPKTFET